MEYKNYADYEKLILKLAWKYNRITGIELEELVAEANLQFVECQHNFKEEKGKFSTYLYTAIKNHLQNMCIKSRCSKYKAEIVGIEEWEPIHPPSQEDRCIFSDKIKNLSQEAKEIIETVLHAPLDLVDMLPKSTLNKHQLSGYLRLKGWKIPAITKAFKEISQIL